MEGEGEWRLVALEKKRNEAKEGVVGYMGPSGNQSDEKAI